MASAAPSAAASERRSATISKYPEPLVAPSDAAASVDPPRLFVLCGRDRKVEELREMFARSGTIRQLHLATDRSNKSRASGRFAGFAFLQYEDATSASEAIKQFDKTTLSDGHVLKVTVAREKSRTGALSAPKPPQPGKLKRNQHSQSDHDDHGDDSNATDGGLLPGKRQRSSPPSLVTSMSLAPSSWKRAAPFVAAVAILRSSDEEISDILNGMVSQIERSSHCNTPESDKGEGIVAVATAPAAAKRKATASTCDQADSTKAPHRTRSLKVDSEDGITGKQKSQRTTVAQATPGRASSHREAVDLHPRRRTRVEESDSSVDDASDASVGRRKRSNVEPNDEESERVGAAMSRRRLSDLSELSLSAAGVASPMSSKKRCSRRSSASSSTSSLPPSQATAFRPLVPMNPPVFAPASALPLMRRRPTIPHAKLFFTSTVKFTEQELEAMFSIYEHFESVQSIKSFGRLKTMAYVLYATPAAASSVLTSFLHDNEGEDHGMTKLVFAEVEEPTGQFAYNPPARYRTQMTTAGESTSSEVPVPVPTTDAEPIELHSEHHCWVMILYDRGLSNEAISSCAAECEGMEYMDIKMFRSTGESQGVAFVKFNTEDSALAASRQLHNTEFPVGTRKVLQAMVIADPALFSTAHGASAPAGSAQPSSQEPLHHGEDGDLGFVEARFAHLMSGTSEQPSASAHAVPVDEVYDGSEQMYPTSGSGGFVGPNPYAPPMAAPPFGYFHFGQPYPYTGSPHPSPHPHRPMFYPQDSYGGEQYPWGYDSMHQVWPSEAASPMQTNYHQHSWALAASGSAISCGGPGPASSQGEPTSVFVSSSRPLDLSSLMKAIQECPGVVGFSKDEKDGGAYVVDFGEPQEAADAASKLDGTMCNGNKLRVAVASGYRPPPSRRKRQRIDQRGRRK